MVVLLLGVMAVVGLCAWWAYAVRQSNHVKLGIPEQASVASVDAGRGAEEAGVKALTLHDDEWGLTGKIDLLLDESHGPVPVEWKRADVAPKELRPSHQMQIGTYLLLCEADPQVDRRPQYGLVQYLDKERRFLLDARFKVPNSEILRQAVIDTVQAMRRALTGGEVHRNHCVAAKCRKCSVKAACGEALA